MLISCVEGYTVTQRMLLPALETVSRSAMRHHTMLHNYILLPASESAIPKKGEETEPGAWLGKTAYDWRNEPLH